MNTAFPNHPPNRPDPLAVSLAKLDPAPHGFEWNALMFAAGRASKGRALMFWRIVAGACAVVASGLAFAYFTRPSVVVEHQRIVYVDRVAPPQTEVPVAPPLPLPKTQPDVPPAPSTDVPSTGWTFDPPPEQGSAARWLRMRNEVLTVGLGVLPDSGPKMAPPKRGEQ